MGSTVIKMAPCGNIQLFMAHPGKNHFGFIRWPTYAKESIIQWLIIDEYNYKVCANLSNKSDFVPDLFIPRH